MTIFRTGLHVVVTAMLLGVGWQDARPEAPKNGGGVLEGSRLGRAPTTLPHMRAILEAAQPEGENAWDHVLRAGVLAAESHVQIVDRYKALHQGFFSPCLPASASLDEYSDVEVEAGVEMYNDLVEKGVFELVARCSRCPRVVPKFTNELRPIPLTDIGALDRITEMIKSRYAQAAEKADRTEMLAAIDNMLTCARTVSWIPDSVGRHRAHSFERSALEMIRKVCATEDMTADELAVLFARLRTYDPPGTSIVVMGESLLLRRALGKRGAGPAIVRQQQAIDTISIALSDYVDLPRAQRTEDVLDDVLVEPAQRTLGATMLRTVSGLADGQDAVLTERAGTLLLIALEIHRARHGAYPDALGVLAAVFGDAPPGDRYNGSPFLYRKTETGYVLYSPGADGSDDDATPAKVPSRAWQADGAGTDFVFVSK